MLKRDPEDEALQQILGDMDGFEAKSLGGDGNKGVSVTISVEPNGGGEGEDYPEGHDVSLCGGGCALHAGGPVDEHSMVGANMVHDDLMAAGGVVGGEADEKKLTGQKLVHDDLAEKKVSRVGEEGTSEDDDKSLPPFLRKKKKPLQDA